MKFLFAHEIIKKPPQKVACLSIISVVSEIFLNTAQQPKWQNSCSQMWHIEQLYIELGCAHKKFKNLPKNCRFLKEWMQQLEIQAIKVHKQIIIESVDESLQQQLNQFLGQFAVSWIFSWITCCNQFKRIFESNLSHHRLNG